MFKEIDHIAVVVKNTEEALMFYRDQLGLPLLFSEELADPGVRLTHLDMGNLRLQLVQPLRADHPLQEHLKKRGEGFHHICWKVGDIDEAMGGLEAYGLVAKANEPHSAPNGGRAAFIEPSETRGVLLEMTGT